MSRMCDVCSKTYVKANQVPRGIGRRVASRSIKRQQPNLRLKSLMIAGQKLKVKLCTACLKRIKYDEKLLQSVASAKVAATAA